MRAAVATVLGMTLAAPAAQAQDAKTFWKNFLRGCATTDVMKGKLVYLGPTNNMGLGAIWRKVGGVWRPRREFDDSVAPEAIRKSVINEGNEVPCTGEKTKKWSFNPTLVLQSLIAPFGADVSADLGKATTVTVSLDSHSWDTLLEGKFADNLKNFAQEYREDLRQRDVAGRVLRIHGLTAELTFAGTTQAKMEIKYKKGVDLKGGSKAEWTNEGKLKITAPQTAFIVIQPWKFEEKGFQSAEGKKYFRVDDSVTLGAKAAPSTDSGK
jgi:hypothetical protein